MEACSNPLGWPVWAWRTLFAFAVLLAVYGLAGSLSNFARAAGLISVSSDTGFALVRPAGTPTGWSVATNIAPGGAADRAGIKQADLIRFDGLFGNATCCPAEQPKAMTVDREGVRFRTQIVAAPNSVSARTHALHALFGIGGLATTCFALALLLRGGGSRAAVQLSMILLMLGVAAARCPPWAPTQGVAQAWWLIGATVETAIAFFWPLFALEISGGPSSRLQYRLVVAFAVLSTVLSLLANTAPGVPIHLPIIGPSMTFSLLFVVVHQVFGYAVIVRNYRRNDPPARNRLKIVVVAFLCYTLSQIVISGASRSLAAGISPEQVFWWGFVGTVFAYAGFGLLAYAVLRQKLFDLNFALNRTLVYATVSFVLLAAFGLAKWVIEHLIPEEWHAGSEYYSVAIALVLFLVLHRVHNGVERNIERVFFRPWHRNEEALRRFVSAAGHFDETPVLCRAFAGEVSRFAKGAGATLYLRQPDGSYAQGCGTLANAPSEQPSDDLALALMRAERRPVRTTETQTTLPGVLTLPMLDHGKLAGFLLLDRKPDGADYRPDEIEVLGWAAHQVGLDLQAMHAGELEAEVAALNARVASLAEERDRLGALLAGSSAAGEGHAELGNSRRKPRQQKEKVAKVTG